MLARASLADRRRPLVRRPHRSRSRRPDARPALAARPRRPERRGQVDAAPPRGRARRAGRGHGRAHARVADGRLPAAGARPPRRRDAAGLPRPAHRHRGGRGGGEAAHGRLEPGRVRRRARTVPGARRRRPRGAGANRLRRARPAGLARPGDGDALRRRGGSGGARRDPALPLRPAPARRADERPRLRRARPPGALRRRLSPAASPSSRTTAPSSTGPSTGSPRSIPGPAACASTRAAGATTPRRASEPGRSSTPPSRTRRSGRREVEALLHARRNQARAGGGFLAHATGGSDRRGTKALSGKVRQAERALERIEQVEKPYEPWRLHLSLAAAQRPGDRVASLEGAVGERGSFRLGPDRSRPRAGRARRDHGQEREREVDAAGAAARRAGARGREPPDRPLDRDRDARPAP